MLRALDKLYTGSPVMRKYVDVHLVYDSFDRQFNMWRNVAKFFARTEVRRWNGAMWSRLAHVKRSRALTSKRSPIHVAVHHDARRRFLALHRLSITYARIARDHAATPRRTRGVRRSGFRVPQAERWRRPEHVSLFKRGTARQEPFRLCLMQTHKYADDFLCRCLAGARRARQERQDRHVPQVVGARSRQYQLHPVLRRSAWRGVSSAGVHAFV